MNTTAKFLAPTLLALAAAAASAQSPTHLYMMDSAADALGGPALVPAGGSFGATFAGQTGYRFGANQGFFVSGAVPSFVYTLDFSFAFDTVSGYRRLIEFTNLLSDNGLYVLDGALNFYPLSAGVSEIVPGQLTRITLTRTGFGFVAGYVNGVRRVAFDDLTGLALFGPAQIAWFFRDDDGADETSAGFVDYLRVYNVALSATQVANLPPPAIPEPGTWALMALGLGALALSAGRRSRR